MTETVIDRFIYWKNASRSSRYKRWGRNCPYKGIPGLIKLYSQDRSDSAESATLLDLLLKNTYLDFFRWFFKDGNWIFSILDNM